VSVRALLGIFVGGRSRRMGVPKGRLPAPGSNELLVERLAGVGRALDLDPVLVGDATPYADVLIDVPRLTDEPAGIGPLGGLASLLARAGPSTAITVACDMPHLDAAALEVLLAAPAAAVLAPRDAQGRWQPFFARWRAPSVRPLVAAAIAADVRSFQRLLARLQPTELPRDPALERALVDWDSPEDVDG